MCLKPVNGGFLALVENIVEAQRSTHRQMNKKDEKYLLLINQCEDSNAFEKTIEQETTKDV